MLRFYYASGSPIAWRVWLALEHKRIPYELVTLSLSEREHEKPAFLAINPRGQVPAIDDDGFCLSEASAIVEYLDDRHPNEPLLLPRDVQKRATCRRIISEVDEQISPPQFRLARQIFFTKLESRDEAEIRSMRDTLASEIAKIGQALSGEWFMGDEISAADFTLYPLLAVWRRLEMRREDLGLMEACGPGIRAWMARVEALPYFDRTLPPHWRESSSPTPATLKGRSA